MDEINLIIKSMKHGLRVGDEETLEPAGSFRELRNAMITNRGGIAKRPGISVIGDYDSSGNAVKGLFRWKQMDGTELLIKARGTTHQYLDTTWEDLESGLTAARTDYTPHFVNVEGNADLLYFTDKENGYRNWYGWVDRTTAALTGGETEIPVTSVLKPDVFYSGTASSVSTTTIDVSGTPWAANNWNEFVVKITSGSQDGKISIISATTNNQITFTAITGLSGTPTFEIRRLSLPATGSVLLNGTSINYTGISSYNSLTVASAHATPEGSPVVVKPTVYPAAPKGDSIDVWLTKIIVSNIKSAMAKDSLGNDVATAASRSIYVSNSEDGTDFSFSAPRSADEGDIIGFAYGGGAVLDVIAQEDAFYGGTPEYIEKITYTQDIDATGSPTDLVQREPLKPGIGLTGRFIRGKDDIYFFTPAGELTSIGRVTNVDIKPQSLDIGYAIRRLLADRVNDEADGIEYRNRLLLTHKFNSDSTHNDRVLVYNRETKSFEGDWLLPASCFTIWNDKPAFGQSNGANAFQMYDGEVDIWDNIEYPITTRAKSNWINITPSSMEDQAVLGVHVEGYIRGNSEFDWFLYADFSDTPVLSVNFSGSETDFIYSSNISASLGTAPLGSEPLGSVDEADAEGYRRFRFTVWFPDIYCNALSWGFEAGGANQYVELNKVAFTVFADPMRIAPGLIKS
jgi:hypothetical protein